MSNDPLGRAQSLLGLRRFDEAAAAAREGLAHAPDDAALLTTLAAALVEGGDPEEGARVAARAVAADPQSSSAHSVLGWALHRQRRYDEAIAELETAAALDPTVSDPHEMLVEALLRQADQRTRLSRHTRERTALLAAAQRHASEALRLDPESAIPHILHAKLAMTGGDPIAARRWANQGLAIDPNNHVGHQLLGLLAEADGDLRAAGDHYVEAGTINPRSSTSIERLRSLRGAAPLGGIAVFLVFRLLVKGGQASGGGHWALIGLIAAVAIIVGANVWWPRRRAARALSDRARRALESDRKLGDAGKGSRRWIWRLKR